MLAVQDPSGQCVQSHRPRPEPAVRRALTVEELASRLAKTGGTAYVCAPGESCGGTGAVSPAAAINGMRRECFGPAHRLRGRRKRRSGQIYGPMIHPPASGRPRVSRCRSPPPVRWTKKLAEYAAPVFVCAFVPPGSGPGFLRPDGPPGPAGGCAAPGDSRRRAGRITRQLDEVYDLGGPRALGNLGRFPVARAWGLPFAEILASTSTTAGP